MIKVMIVDDSALVRQLLTDMLNSASDIDVIATASDPIFATRKIEQQTPDVLILDLEMPRMDGLTFLRKLMRERPLPVVIYASLSVEGAKRSMEAMSSGAVAVVAKPQQELKIALPAMSEQLLMAVRSAAHSGPLQIAAPSEERPAKGKRKRVKNCWDLVLIGASTGGTQAIESVISKLDKNCPGIVIVQHMPAGFTAAFAERLNAIYEVEVQEAYAGARVRAGLILIAPGGKQLTVQRDRQGYYVDVILAPPVNRHCPSVDVMFQSASEFKSDKIAALLLTGMGSDGAKGLLALRRANSITFAQDEESSVVYGMPKEAIKAGAALYTVGLSKVSNIIVGDIEVATRA